MIMTTTTSTTDRPVRVATASAVLSATLSVPARAHSLVILANGSGDPVYVAGNAEVSRALHDAGFATLVVDLLTSAEKIEDAETSALRFDLDFLAERIIGAATWASHHPALWSLRIGMFAGGTSAAAALVAAARRPDIIGAVVSRGGRPELAGAVLSRVKAPTLLLVGALDSANTATNLHALELLPVSSQIQMLPGSRHMLDEPETLESVARLTAGWFARHLVGEPALFGGPRRLSVPVSSGA